MPRTKKKSASKLKPAMIEHHIPRQGISAYAKSSYKWAESYTSLLMGVVVIIVAVLFVISLVRATHHVQDTSSTSTGPTPSVAQTTKMQPSTYTVRSGDDLWHIAEKTYGDGDKWVEIAQANNLSNPDTIFAGNKLLLPKITKTPIPIQDISYTVEPGDSLWNIAVAQYKDGYKWVDIAKANNLQNPSIIHAGNLLKIPK